MGQAKVAKAMFEAKYYRGSVLEVTDWEPKSMKIPKLEQITLKQIKLGSFNGAIVFVVSTDCSSDVEAICKIYDDMLSPSTLRCSTGDGRNSLGQRLITGAYAFKEEKPVYERLRSKPEIIQGITPEYYGHGKIKTGSGDEWSIILIEHVCGKTLDQVDPAKLERDQRRVIMRKLIEADSDIMYYGRVVHKDLAPRNVIVETRTVHSGGNETEEIPEDPRVCLIDFVNSVFLEKAKNGRLWNPIFRWSWKWEEWAADESGAGGWLDRDDAENWMWEEWGKGKPEKGYRAVEKDDVIKVCGSL